LIVFVFEAAQEKLWRRIEVGQSPNVFPQVAVAADGSFELAGLKAETEYAFQVGRVPRGWWLASAVFETAGQRLPDRDLLDTGLKIQSPTSRVPEVTLRFVNWQTTLSGKVVLEATDRPADYAVIAAPVETSLWRRPSRRIRSTRLTPAGEFSILGLPLGEYMLRVLRVADFKPEELYDRGFLTRLSDRATKVTLRDRQPQSLTLQK
jgi:hypothetical protein